MKIETKDILIGGGLLGLGYFAFMQMNKGNALSQVTNNPNQFQTGAGGVSVSNNNNQIWSDIINNIPDLAEVIINGIKGGKYNNVDQGLIDLGIDTNQFSSGNYTVTIPDGNPNFMIGCPGGCKCGGRKNNYRNSKYRS